MLSQIDALLRTLSSEEKEVLKRKSQIALNRRHKPFITGTKERAKRQTRNNAWTFLSEYYGIIFHAPINSLHPLVPPTQSDQLDTLLHVKRKGQNNDQPAPKRPCLPNEAAPLLANTTGTCVEDKNHDWFKKFFDDIVLPSSSSSSSSKLGNTGCSNTMPTSGEVDHTLVTLKTRSRWTVPGAITAHQEPCLLLGLYELFNYRRELFDKLCTELNI